LFIHKEEPKQYLGYIYIIAVAGNGCSVDPA